MNPYQVNIFYANDDPPEWQARATLEDHTVLASVRLRAWRECACVGVTYQLSTREDYQKQGIATALVDAIESHALKQGITLLLATVREDNLASCRVMGKRGFRAVSRCQNPRTRNTLLLFSKTLLPASKPNQAIRRLMASIGTLLS